MPPLVPRRDDTRFPSISSREFRTEADIFRRQWSNPNDILSLLLLLGPDIVQRAIAQLAGNAISPIAFSFGWVTYSINALLAVIGGGKLMPDTDSQCLLIGAKSGHVRNNKAWIIGRLLRDIEKDTDNTVERKEVPHQAETRRRTNQSSKSAQTSWEALRVCVYSYRDEESLQHGVPNRDWLWYVGFAVISMQVALALVPWVMYASWGTFVVTIGGTFLATFTSSLPQWGREKWSCPHTSTTVTLTRGNGCRQAIVILGTKNVGLDLEILANGTRTEQSSRLTRLATPILAFLWVILLVCVAGMDDHSWYLLGIGSIGILQNIFAAGAARKPGALGIHIRPVEVIKGSKVQGVLKEVEEKYPLVGTSLLPVFFPGTMRIQEGEISFWREAIQKRMAPNEFGFRVDTLPPEPAQQGPVDDHLGHMVSAS